MSQKKLVNVNIESSYPIPTPQQISRQIPISKASQRTVADGRGIIQDILDGKDRRLFLVVGPCSIHDPKAALEYAERLKRLADKVQDRFFIVMRVYFEKPRTTLGWKGFINDPFMNDSFHMEEGLKRARKLLLRITELGLAAGSEALDPITPQYLAELVCWYAIGARTIESQTHREIASGLSAPVGFKNGTDGNIQVAINAMHAALTPHHFLGMDLQGRVSVFTTRGNSCSHVVLRGGLQPNYDKASIANCRKALAEAGLRRKIMIDCSHGNSSKDHRQQPAVFEACIKQVREGDRSIIGMMLESNLHEGSQPIPPDLKGIEHLKYGVSVTDDCMDWATTEHIILKAFKKT